MDKETAMKILRIPIKEKTVLVCEEGVKGRDPVEHFEVIDKLYGPVAQGYVSGRFEKDVLEKGK